MAKTVHSMIQEKQTVAQTREIFRKTAPYFRTECNIESLSTDDIRQLIEEHEYELDSVPIIFIDYLQILKAHDPHMSDKQSSITTFCVSNKFLVTSERLSLFYRQ